MYEFNLWQHVLSMRVDLERPSEQWNGWTDLLSIIFFCYILIFILKTRKLQVIKSTICFTLVRR